MATRVDSRVEIPINGDSAQPRQAKLVCARITSVDAATDTTRAFSIAGIESGARIVGMFPRNAKAAILTATIWATVSAANTLTLTYASTALDGTESWDVTIESATPI